MKTKFVKPIDIRAYFRKEYPDLRLTYGFLAFLDVHLEYVFKRAVLQKRGKSYLDGASAIIACRYPFHVASSQMDSKS